MMIYILYIPQTPHEIIESNGKFDHQFLHFFVTRALENFSN